VCECIFGCLRFWRFVDSFLRFRPTKRKSKNNKKTEQNQRKAHKTQLESDSQLTPRLVCIPNVALLFGVATHKQTNNKAQLVTKDPRAKVFISNERK
jgi:hypothetical protein